MRRSAALAAASLLVAGLALLLVGLRPAADARAPFAGTDAVNAVLGDASFVAAFGRPPGPGDDEELRSRVHLEYVEALLRARDVRHLSPALRAARVRQLDRLREYRLAGGFPKNTVVDHSAPVFIDEEGRICAVGYLFEQDRGRAAAEAVNARFRTALLYDMDDPVLADWLATSGLSLDEAAMIQPFYTSVGAEFEFTTVGPTACGTNENPVPVIVEPFPSGNTVGSMARTPLLTCGDGVDDVYESAGFAADFDPARMVHFPVTALSPWSRFRVEGDVRVRRAADGPSEARLVFSMDGGTTFFEGAAFPIGEAWATQPLSLLRFGQAQNVLVGFQARGGAGALYLDDVSTLNIYTPVELTAFTGTADGDAASLVWETASETSNAGFEVEHRAPGTADYAAVGFVEGHGTTTEPQRYAFRTERLAPGTHAFRLRQVDFDGQSEHSGAVEVEIAAPAAFALSAAQPNPFAGGTAFTLAVARTQRVSLAVYDALGRRVASLYDGVLDAGTARPFALDGRGLAAGLLVVRAVGEHFTASRVVTLVR